MTTAIVVGLGLILAGHPAAAKGLILSTLFSVINFVLIGEALPLKLAASGRKHFFLAMLSIGIRYACLAVPLVVAVKSDQFDLVAAVIGIFMIQFMILSDPLLKLLPATRKKTL
jgi:Na+-transporting NADH:ubiquinone oxidoreductase subunit NqrB